MEARDPETGISMRFIRQWSALEDARRPPSEFERAMALAYGDMRAVPFVDKVNDACVFLKQRREVATLEEWYRY